MRKIRKGVEFTPMHKFHKDEDGDRFAIRVFDITEEEVRNARIRSLMNFSGEYNYLRAGRYVKLVDKQKSEVVMSDTQMEQMTNETFVRNANGHVLIGGLGIGMVLIPLMEDDEVIKITVLEKHQEVIDLVAKNLPLTDKVEIINCDVFDYEVPKGEKYDVVYMDIWNNIDGENWEEYKMLCRKFSRKINRGNERCMNSAWRKEDVRRLANY